MEQELIDTWEAASILQVANCRTALSIAKREGLSIQWGRYRNALLSRSEVESLAVKRGGKVGRGRPKKHSKIIPDEVKIA